MIVVTRLNGPPFAVNPDLVQRIDSAPDTILTLVDGTKYIVEESMAQVIESINEHRSRMIARAQEIQRDDAPRDEATSRPTHLHSAPELVSDHRDPSRGESPRDRGPELALVKHISGEES